MLPYMHRPLQDHDHPQVPEGRRCVLCAKYTTALVAIRSMSDVVFYLEIMRTKPATMSTLLGRFRQLIDRKLPIEWCVGHFRTALNGQLIPVSNATSPVSYVASAAAERAKQCKEDDVTEMLMRIQNGTCVNITPTCQCGLCGESCVKDGTIEIKDADMAILYLEILQLPPAEIQLFLQAYEEDWANEVPVVWCTTHFRFTVDLQVLPITTVNAPPTPTLKSVLVREAARTAIRKKILCVLCGCYRDPYRVFATSEPQKSMWIDALSATTTEFAQQLRQRIDATLRLCVTPVLCELHVQEIPGLFVKLAAIDQIPSIDESELMEDHSLELKTKISMKQVNVEEDVEVCDMREEADDREDGTVYEMQMIFEEQLLEDIRKYPDCDYDEALFILSPKVRDQFRCKMRCAARDVLFGVKSLADASSAHQLERFHSSLALLVRDARVLSRRLAIRKKKKQILSRSNCKDFRRKMLAEKQRQIGHVPLLSVLRAVAMPNDVLIKALCYYCAFVLSKVNHAAKQHMYEFLLTMCDETETMDDSAVQYCNHRSCMKKIKIFGEKIGVMECVLLCERTGYTCWLNEVRGLLSKEMSTFEWFHQRQILNLDLIFSPAIIEQLRSYRSKLVSVGFVDDISTTVALAKDVYAMLPAHICRTCVVQDAIWYTWAKSRCQ